MSPITADVQVPQRSRTFTPDEAQEVYDLLRGRRVAKDDEGNPVLDDEGNPTEEEFEPAKNVGYGSFDTPGSARSAGVTLNRLLESLGAPHKYAVSTFQRDGKHVGVMYNKPAIVRKEAESSAGGNETSGGGSSSRRSRSR